MAEVGRPPCEWLPRPDLQLANYGDAVMQVACTATIDHLYPDKRGADEAEKALLYERALEEHGFERSRGLEYGLLLQVLADCGAVGYPWCAGCPLADNQGWMESRLDVLQAGALASGITAEELPAFADRMQRYAREFRTMADSTLDIDSAIVLGNRMRIEDASIPPGYSLFIRQAQLPDGSTARIMYSVYDNQTPDTEAFARSSAAVTEAFVWALQTPKFADGEITGPNDRGMEIGNMFSFALTRGLTENQVAVCYAKALQQARRRNR